MPYSDTRCCSFVLCDRFVRLSAQAHGCTHTCAGQRSTSGAVPWEHRLVFKRQGLSLGSRACRLVWADRPEGFSNPTSPMPGCQLRTSVFLWVPGSSHLQRTSYQLTYLPSPSSLIFLIRLWLFNSLLSYFLDEKLKFSTSQLRGSWPESKPQFILNPCTRLPLPGTPSPW